MGLADKVEKLVSQKLSDESSDEIEKASQLKELERVEAVLKSIGVSLEPKFDISLSARIGAVSAKA